MSANQTPVLAMELRAREPEPQASDALVAVVEKLAANPGVTVEALAQVIALQERVAANRAKAAFDSAFAEMQAAMPVVIERANGGTGNKYAPLEDIVEAVRPIITKYGFALSHRTEWPDKAIVKVIGILSHREGHEKHSEFMSAADSSGSKNAIQGLGSAISYGRRYTTNDLLNIVTRKEDDDARKASPAHADAPDDYDDWLDALKAKASEGLPALTAMWNTANADPDLKPFVKHLMRADLSIWNQLKQDAGRVKTR